MRGGRESVSCSEVHPEASRLRRQLAGRGAAYCLSVGLGAGMPKAESWQMIWQGANCALERSMHDTPSNVGWLAPSAAAGPLHRMQLLVHPCNRCVTHGAVSTPSGKHTHTAGTSRTCPDMPWDARHTLIGSLPVPSAINLLRYARYWHTYGLS